MTSLQPRDPRLPVRFFIAFFAFLLFLSSTPLLARQAAPATNPAATTAAVPKLTNDDIIRYLQVGFSDEQIITVIRKNDGGYDLSEAGLQALSKSKVSAAVAVELQAADARTAKNDQDALLNKIYGAGTAKPAAPEPAAQPSVPAAASLSLSKSNIDFGQQSLGTQSATQSITVTNTGSNDVPFFIPKDLPMTSQADTPPFRILDSSTCATKLAHGDHCTIDVAFAPFSYNLSKNSRKSDSIVPFSSTISIVTDQSAAAALNTAQSAVMQTRLQAATIQTERDTAQSALKALRCGSKDAVCQDNLNRLQLSLDALNLSLKGAQDSLNKALADFDSALKSAGKAGLSVPITGTPKRWTFPFSNFVAGLDASEASSQDPQQTYFVQANLVAPLPFLQSSLDPLDRRLWVFFNPRLTSLPFQDSNAAVSTLNTNADFLSGLLGGKISGITQGLQFNGGFEWVCPGICRKPRRGAGWISEFQGTTARARFSDSLILGFGASTPFSNQTTPPPAFVVNESILEAFGCKQNPSFPVKPHPFCGDLLPSGSTPPAKANISFAFPDRSRFFYNFFVGLRLKTTFFNPDVHGVCRDSNGRDSLDGCEMPFNIFPGTVDLTAGKDAIVTGGRLSKWLFRIDVAQPIPFVPSFYIFGSTYLAFGKTFETPPITLNPAASGSATDANTERVILPRPDRDIFRIGIGVDLLQLLSKGGGKPADTTAKPPATTAITDKQSSTTPANPPAGTTPTQPTKPKNP